jgi:hypothetical protein
MNMQHSSVIIHFFNAYSMSITANTTYTASFPKRPDITGASNQVFKFDNFLDRLIRGIKANTKSTIGTINPGSLCNQFLYAPQIHFNLAGNPIAFIENSFKKMGKYSLIKIDVTSIHLFPYIEDKATMNANLNHGDNMPTDWLINTNWKDFKKPIVGTLIPNFFITYFGQVLPHGHGNISDNEIKAKLVCLGTGYELWATIANIAVKKLDNILSVMEEIRTPESIKKYLDLTQDAKSLPLATSNDPFGAMTLVQSDDHPVAAHVIKDYSNSVHRQLLQALLLLLLVILCFIFRLRSTKNLRPKKTS